MFAALRWVWLGAASASPPATPQRLHRLDLRIPVEDDLVLLQVRSGLVLRRVWLRQRRDGPELAEGVAELRAHAIDRVFKANDLELLRAKILDDRQHEFDAVIVGRQPFLFEEVAELRHIVRADAEDRKRFQHADVLRAFHIIRQLRFAAALEAQAIALETDAATEELDDLRALGLADIHQAHRAHAPTVPALGELLRADQQVDRRMRLVDRVEERACELAVFRGYSVIFAELDQLGVVANVDDAERVVVADAQRDLASGAFQVLDMECAAACGVEEGGQRLIENLGGREAGCVEVGEAAGKEVLSASGDKPLIEDALDALDAPRAIGDISRQELQDLDDVGGIARRERLRHAAADENPERLVDVERPEGEASAL